MKQYAIPPRGRTKLIPCLDCGVTFEDLSGHQLCDGCLVEYVNGAGELEYDELPTAPTTRPALIFIGIAREYWREEAARGCTAALGRLRTIVAQRGCDFDATMREVGL